MAGLRREHLHCRGPEGPSDTSTRHRTLRRFAARLVVFVGRFRFFDRESSSVPSEVMSVVAEADIEAKANKKRRKLRALAEHLVVMSRDPHLLTLHVPTGGPTKGILKRDGSEGLYFHEKGGVGTKLAVGKDQVRDTAPFPLGLWALLD